MHFKHYENPYSGLAQYVNCAAANSGADAGMYDASSEIYKLSTETVLQSNMFCFTSQFEQKIFFMMLNVNKCLFKSNQGGVILAL